MKLRQNKLYEPLEQKSVDTYLRHKSQDTRTFRFHSVPYILLYPRLHRHGLELNPIFLLPLRTSRLLLL